MASNGCVGGMRKPHESAEKNPGLRDVAARIRRALEGFAHDLGLAYQITDDLLDATGDETVPYDVPATLQLDATWVVEPSDRFTVNLGVENLLDVGADPETLVQSRPRRVFLGLTGRLGHLGERP